MKRIAVLGITGSIGMQTLDVVARHPEEFEIVAISAGYNMAGLQSALTQCNPKLVCVARSKDADRLSGHYPKIEFVCGEDGLRRVATYPQADLVVNALVGFVGLQPTLAAIEANKDIALANKETLVVGGQFVIEACKRHNVRLLPIDSEHSAIFQALQGNRLEDVKKLVITASGGSFRDKTRDELVFVTKEEALHHPNWSMGAKITIDSATMMNKGLEVIEAHWLFDKDFDDIEVLMHKESVIHSMVEYIDGALMAQLGSPDMRLCIQYALSYPKRLPGGPKAGLNLADMSILHFSPVDFDRYPLLRLAYHVGRLGGNLPAVMNAANEEAVRLFLDDKISFLRIEELVLKACSDLPYVADITLDDIYRYDKMARDYVLSQGGNR